MVRRLALVALVAATCACREQPPSSPPAIRLSFPVPDGVESGSLDAAISPDERQIVFVATSRPDQGFRGHAGTTQLWRRALDAERAEPLAGTDGAQLPAWKQTGNVVAFFAAGRLKQISMQDGAVADLAAATAASGATWLADGSLLFAPDASGPIRRLLNGRLTDATTLAEGDTGHVFPVVRGASDDFVYVALRSDGRRVARLVTAGAQHPPSPERDGGHALTTTTGHAMLVDHVLLHVQDDVLLASMFDPETKTLPGRGIPVALDVGVSDSGAGLFAASPRFLIHSRRIPRAREIAWFDAHGSRLGAIGDVGDHWQVRLSPDDRHAAVTTLDPLLRTLDVFVTPATEGGYTERLTLSLSADTDPVWSPDGTRVMFRSMQDGVPNLFTRRAHTRGAKDEPVLRSMLDETPTDWRASGDVLFHARGHQATPSGGSGRLVSDVFRLTLRDGTFVPVLLTGFNDTDARWSPDGRLIAHVVDESGQPDVYVQHPDSSRHRMSFAGGTRPRWSRDGRTLFFLRGSQVMRATVEPGSSRFANAQPAFEVPGIVDFDVAHRSDRFLVIRSTAETPRGSAGVVMNWRSLVDQGEAGRE